MKKVLIFAGVGVILIVALGIGAALLFLGLRPRVELEKPPEHGSSFLLQFDQSGLSGETNAFALMHAAMGKRFSEIGARFYMERVSEDRFRILIPDLGPESAEIVRGLVTRAGKLEFRLVHPESDRLLQNGELPTGYVVLEREEKTRAGTEMPVPGNVIPVKQQAPTPTPTVEKVVVKKNPETALAGDIVEFAMLRRSRIGLPEIEFKLKPEAATALAKVTRHNVGGRLAIILDDKLCSAPVIQDPITTGTGAVTGGFDEKEGSQLCCILNSPLPTPVTLLEAKSF